MNRTMKILAGVAALGFGLLLLVGLLGGAIARIRGGTMLERHRTAVVEEGATADAEPFGRGAAIHDRAGHAGRSFRGPGMFFMAPLALLGGLLRISLLGLLFVLLFRTLKKRRDQGAGPEARQVPVDVGAEIRVGDDGAAAPAGAAGAELTIEELRAAMKRLGIDKLEL